MVNKINIDNISTPMEDFTFFYVHSSRTATVVSYLGHETNVRIPSSTVYHDIVYQVTSIGSNAFRNKHLQSVQIPDTILTIGESAFWNNQLSHLVIPDSVTRIGANAFRENELVDVVLPKTLETVGNHVFFRNQLREIHIPNTVVHIGNSAFTHNALTQLTIPNSVRSIGDSAFSSNQLTHIEIPNTVTTIGNSVFYNNELIEVTLPTNITSIPDSLFYKNRLSSVQIPNTVTSIGNNAFRENQLTHLEFPSSMISIGNSAFRTNHLTWMKIPASVKMIGDDAFSTNPMASIYTDEGNARKLTQMLNLNTMRRLSTSEVMLVEGEIFFQVNYTNPQLEHIVTVGDHLSFNVDVHANHYYIRNSQADDWFFMNGSIVPIQWYKDGLLLKGEDQNTLQLTNIQKDQAGVYYAIVNHIQLPDIHLAVVAAPPNTSPKNLIVTATTITLNWHQSTSTQTVSGYRIYRNHNVIGEVDPQTTSFVDSDLIPNTIYVYVIEAFDTTGNTARTDAMTFVTTAQ